MFNPQVFTQVKARLHEWATLEMDNDIKDVATFEKTKQASNAALEELQTAGEVNIGTLSDILDHHTFSLYHKRELFGVLLNADSKCLEIQKITSDTPFGKLASIYKIEFEDGEHEEISAAELATLGNFFRALVNTPMSEAATKKVKIEGMNKEEFKFIRDFFKGEEFNFDDTEAWVAANDLADRFQIDELKHALIGKPFLKAVLANLDNDSPELNLTNMDVTENDLEEMHVVAKLRGKSLSHIKTIKFSSASLSERFINALPRELENLHIPFCSIIKSEGLATKVLNSIPSAIKNVYSYWAGPISIFNGLPPGLKVFELGQKWEGEENAKMITDMDIKALPRTLRKLSLLGSSAFTTEGIKSLPRDLEVLRGDILSDEVIFDDFPKKLKALYLMPRTSSIRLIPSETLPEELEILDISIFDFRYPHSCGAPMFSKFSKNLKAMRMEDRVTDELLKSLPDGLEALSIFNTYEITIEGLKALPKELKLLDITYNIAGPANEITIGVIKALPKGLNYLGLAYNIISSANIIELLKEQKILKELDITGCNIDEATKNYIRSNYPTLLLREDDPTFEHPKFEQWRNESFIVDFDQWRNDFHRRLRGQHS